MSRLIINLHSHEETSHEGIYSMMLGGRYQAAKAEHNIGLELTTREQIQTQGQVDGVDSELNLRTIELDTVCSEDISLDQI
ncbi:hypothetical protein VKT23_018987 [Stygiomarasmius scandens]|uniref:Uncharacterized protein n=1 Tax=Marasmiellus scandens TaxID=2682957 RepID=A0ABR1IMQ7_9AGAR